MTAQWAYGIQAYIGPNGSGKTLAMVERLAVPALESGLHVCSSVELFPDRIGCDPALYVPLESWRQIPKLGVVGEDSITNNKPCVLLLDEVNALMPSRQTMDMPAELQRVLNQFRKPRVTVGWSAPAWGRADKQLREVTSLVVLAEGSRPDRWLRTQHGQIARDGSGRKVRVPAGEWPPNRRFTWRLYDAMVFEEFDLDKSVAIEPIAMTRYNRMRGKAHRIYRTEQQVQLLDWVYGGECVNCGGTKRRPACSCDKGGKATPARVHAVA